MGSIEALFPSIIGSDDPVELILLGTGTSSTLPHVDCLTAPPGSKPCRACLATLDPSPDAQKNRRGNTSAVLRVRGRDGEFKTIVIDVGKSFLHSAVQWFPKYGLRRIDAVLITHAHADAMNGLDDLRGWTLGGAIQDHVDIYLSQETLWSVEATFPYMVNKEFASGGGDVPEFRWHPIVANQRFTIGDTGISVEPIAVHHGFCGSKPTPPLSILPAQVATPFENASPCASGLPGSPIGTGASTPKKEDFICFGYIIQDAVVYISDTSHIPEDVMNRITSYKWASPASQSSPESRPPTGPPVLVLDCLGLTKHASHLSLAQSVDYARQIDAQRTYLVGFSHRVAHDEYETLLRAVGGVSTPSKVTEKVQEGLKLLGDLQQQKRIWVRPGYDGLRIFVDDDGKARDLGY